MSCKITGPHGSYNAGDIITTNIRDIAISNDDTVVTYQYFYGTELGTPHMYIKAEDSQWYRVVSKTHGFWCFFARGILETATQIEIVENSVDAAEIAIKWINFPLNTAYLSNLGILQTDYAGYPVYQQGTSNYQYIANLTQLILSIRVENGKQGMFIGWHSIPQIGPTEYLLTGNDALAFNEQTSYGERELGLSGGSKVVWSSNGHVSRWPYWGQDNKWTVAEAAFGGQIVNHVAWCGLDDPTYSLYNDVRYIPTQDVGYPKVQVRPPYYVADYSADMGLVRYGVARKRIEAGVWQYAPFLSDGVVVFHFCNEHPMPNGRPYPFQVFFGAFKPKTIDSSNNYINEPSTYLKEEVLRLVNKLEWPNEPPGKWLKE